MKLLIVEDEEITLIPLVDKFTKEGFEVKVARNGEQGLEMAAAEHPDLILLDIVMPRMDGMTMMARLRESSSWGASVPIILLTNLSADDKIMKGVVRNEPSYYLGKTDWTLNDVVAKVRERLGMTA